MVGKREKGIIEGYTFLVVCCTWLFDAEPARTLETTLYYEPLQTSRKRRRDEGGEGGERETGGREVGGGVTHCVCYYLEVLVPKTWLKVCPDAFMGGAGY